MSPIGHYLKKHGFERLEPKVVLFDMDGVLYDSMPNHAVAWHESMARFGIEMTRDDAYATEGQRGVDTIRQMVRRQKGYDITDDQAMAMYQVKSDIFHAMPEAPLMPGAKDLMSKIRNSGLRIGIVTGSGQRPLIQRLLHDYGEFVDEQHIVTAYDVELGKPHPDPYLMGLKKNGGLSPWQAFVVENAPLGVEAGVAARIFTICVNTGNMAESIFKERGADIILCSMCQLRDCWEELLFSAV